MKKLQLTRLVAGVPKQPAVWLAGGLAVHQVTESYDLAFEAGEKSFDLKNEWKTAYQILLSELDEQESDRTKWRSSKSEPIEEWNRLGPELCIAYFKWRQRNPQLRIAKFDGEPAIELDASVVLPGCDIEVKAYVDRIFEDTVLGDMMIVDIKTGTRKPDSGLQLGVYAACVKQKYGRDIRKGACFMNRRGELATPYDLSRYTPAYVGRELGKTLAAVRAGAFTANVSPSCERLCDVRSACFAAGGELAEKFDPDFDPAAF